MPRPLKRTNNQIKQTGQTRLCNIPTANSSKPCGCPICHLALQGSWESQPSKGTSREDEHTAATLAGQQLCVCAEVFTIKEHGNTTGRPLMIQTQQTVDSHMQCLGHMQYATCSATQQAISSCLQEHCLCLACDQPHISWCADC